MTTVTRTAGYNARESILNLLSDAEVANVSNAEARSVIRAGEDYIDLEHPDLGAQKARAETTIKAGHALSKSAVSDETWEIILTYLKTHSRTANGN
ncbi:MAG: hypothetical protein WC807_02135 [Hyphomicrobium sp.]|jgi:hypothetical protein